MRPMLATPADPESGLPDDGRTWAYEVKWDGMRVLADLHEGRLRLTSRTGRDITAAFPELRRLAEAHPDVLLDGEVIVFASGTPSFAALADRIHVTDARRAASLAARAPATLIVFDILRLYGVDLVDRSWQERRDALERLAPSGVAWQLSPVYDDRDALIGATREQGLEGVVAKRRSSRYQPGVRSPDWVKLAHRRVQVCLVGGWRPESGSRNRIGALLLGVWADDERGDAVPGHASDAPGHAPDHAPDRVPEPALRFAGRVGSGIGASAEADLRRLLAPLRRDDPPFADPVPREDAAGATWVQPRVVVEVTYGQRTETGRLRFPVFRGLRQDVDPAAVLDQ